MNKDFIDKKIAEKFKRKDFENEWTKRMIKLTQIQIKNNLRILATKAEEFARNTEKEIIGRLTQDLNMTDVKDHIDNEIRLTFDRINQAMISYVKEKVSDQCCIAQNSLNKDIQDFVENFEGEMGVSENRGLKSPARSKGTPSMSSYSPSERPTSVLTMNEKNRSCLLYTSPSPRDS